MKARFGASVPEKAVYQMDIFVIRRDRTRSVLPAHETEEMTPAVTQCGSAGAAQALGGYASPQVMDIGTVHDLTGGSASSGNKDANSQYYW